MITIFHHPKCQKSLKALRLLQATGEPLEIIEYLRLGLNRAQIETITRTLQCEIKDIIRHEDALSLGCTGKNEKEQMALVLRHPGILQRPIVLRAGKGLIARPPEKIQELW